MSIAINNSLAATLFGLTNLIIINALIIIIAYLLEVFLQKYGYKKSIVYYEIIENILPINRKILLNDLKDRTGLDIYKIRINNYNFLRDTVEIIIYSK